MFLMKLLSLDHLTSLHDKIFKSFEADEFDQFEQKLRQRVSASARRFFATVVAPIMGFALMLTAYFVFTNESLQAGASGFSQLSQQSSTGVNVVTGQESEALKILANDPTAVVFDGNGASWLLVFYIFIGAAQLYTPVLASILTLQCVLDVHTLHLEHVLARITNPVQSQKQTEEDEEEEDEEVAVHDVSVQHEDQSLMTTRSSGMTLHMSVSTLTLEGPGQPSIIIHRDQIIQYETGGGLTSNYIQLMVSNEDAAVQMRLLFGRRYKRRDRIAALLAAPPKRQSEPIEMETTGPDNIDTALQSLIHVKHMLVSTSKTWSSILLVEAAITVMITLEPVMRMVLQDDAALDDPDSTLEKLFKNLATASIPFVLILLSGLVAVASFNEKINAIPTQLTESMTFRASDCVYLNASFDRLQIGLKIYGVRVSKARVMRTFASLFGSVAVKLVLWAYNKQPDEPTQNA